MPAQGRASGNRCHEIVWALSACANSAPHSTLGDSHLLKGCSGPIEVTLLLDRRSSLPLRTYFTGRGCWTYLPKIDGVKPFLLATYITASLAPEALGLTTLRGEGGCDRRIHGNTTLSRISAPTFDAGSLSAATTPLVVVRGGCVAAEAALTPTSNRSTTAIQFAFDLVIPITLAQQAATMGSPLASLLSQQGQ